MKPLNSDLTINDYDFLIGATIALWGDGALSKKEYSLFYDRLDSCNFEDSKPYTVDHRDLRDPDLTKKEYLLWVFETIHQIKEKIEYDDQEIDYPQEHVLLELISMYLNELKKTEIVGSKKERMLESKLFFTEIANVDSDLTDGEKELLNLIEDNLKFGYWSQNWGYWTIALIFVTIWKSCFSNDASIEQAIEKPDDRAPIGYKFEILEESLPSRYQESLRDL